MSSAEAKYLKINYDEILRELKEYAKERARSHGVRAIVLAGSLAKGTYTGSSDADVLVIADDVPGRMQERYALFAEPTLGIDLEPRIYTTKEFQRKMEEGDLFLEDSLRFGVTLYGHEFFDRLRAKYLTKHSLT